ncbi:IS630 family transposase (plasmid) [Rhizobium sp. CB3090]|uniref:IS630 family transposase n=1 Tax=Rhizobium sp. CB3090 TaxID=3039156 RepID=UPI0024B0C8DB|nr:IS630 family transposase [Rhizobium sp. CB3090]WFU08095.1 IS630 family transposase [Rhizobium sp. CB3090]WFU10858.1 IS630 family transposase [Rhizobium sp. CB3090]WFU10917.1 IS630 family transposase [Rhizobium sp. CB3090]WFU12202.1 IS630 family transposase [Rhizobium sp. CB3090]WFU12339.1 IS630 family transposase [Rhizobium sp. CB3090]
MGTALKIREDYTADELRRLARQSRDADWSRRLLALSVIYEGGSRSQAASIGGVGLQIIRDWVERFNLHGPDGLKTGKATGREPLLDDKQRKALAEAVEKGPVPYLDGVVRWRLVDLVQWLWQEHRVLVSRQTLGRELNAMGYRKLTARPKHHAQDPQAIEEFKKNFPAAVAEIAAGAAKGKRIEIWFQDEARIGQKNKITRRWAKRGTRPSAPHDQRTRSAYIFGAICPKLGKAAALVMPWCDTYAMNQHLMEISRHVAEDAHAILIMDQAGWHMSNNLTVPENVTILPLPPKSPELNPVENLWQFMRENWLSNRVFKSYEDIVDHCCDAWHKLQRQPWRVMSIGHRKWADEF